MEYSFLVKIKDGKITFQDKEHLDEYLKRKNGVFVLTITEGRTKQQNKLYWTYINIISETTGEDPDRLHIIFKEKFLNNESTSTISPKKFIWYLEKIKVEMAEYNIVLPDPPEPADPQADPQGKK
ncbi:MAG: hypothetical protein DRI86_07425 [Bacteroidetes bacterium]|nr:MAG: hypothetical protein DRI86_07425 [Bacteroidota bacterium]